jgi:hypothetical protein
MFIELVVEVGRGASQTSQKTRFVVVTGVPPAVSDHFGGVTVIFELTVNFPLTEAPPIGNSPGAGG